MWYYNSTLPQTSPEGTNVVTFFNLTHALDCRKGGLVIQFKKPMMHVAYLLWYASLTLTLRHIHTGTLPGVAGPLKTSEIESSSLWLC